MEKDMTEALKRWLDAVLPLVAETLSDALTPEVLADMGNSEGVNGPISIDMSQYGAPITGVNFYIVVVKDLMMISTSIQTDVLDSFGEPLFDTVFTTTDFPKDIKKKESLDALKQRIVELYEDAASQH